MLEYKHMLKVPNSHHSSNKVTLRQYLKIHRAQKDLKRSRVTSVRYESDVERQFYQLLLELQKNIHQFVSDKKMFSCCYEMLEDLKDLFRRAVKRDLFDRQSKGFYPPNDTIIDAISESPSFSEDLFEGLRVKEPKEELIASNNNSLKVGFKNQVDVLNSSSASQVYDDKFSNSKISLKLYDSDKFNNFFLTPKVQKRKKNFKTSGKSKFSYIISACNDDISSQKQPNLESTSINEDESKIRKGKHSATYCYRK